MSDLDELTSFNKFIIYRRYNNSTLKFIFNTIFGKEILFTNLQMFNQVN